MVGCDFLILEAFACSDVGVQRTGNEDNLYFNGLVKEESALSFEHSEKMNIKKSRAVFGVFDGMGGYANGEHAAYLTADTAKTVLKENKKGDPQQLLEKICIDSNIKVCDEVKKNSGQKMGATLAMLYFEGTHYNLCNVGDSPIYLMRKGELTQLSLEHTEAATYFKIYGEAPPKENKLPLTQHIGMSENLSRLNPYYQRENVAEGDMFLICSDGLTDMLDNAEIARIINSSRPLSGIGEILLHNALDRGGTDNISFILVKATDVGEPVIEIPKREPIKTEVPKTPKKESEAPQNKESSLAPQKTPEHHADNNKKDINAEKKAERKAIAKIVAGTIIFAVAVAAAAFFFKDSYLNAGHSTETHDTPNSLVLKL